MPTDHHTEEIADLLRRREAEPRTHTFARLAELYRGQGDLDSALRVVRGGLENHPHYVTARLVHARVLGELGQASDAVTELQRILAFDEENPIARAALGRPGDGPGAAAGSAERWNGPARAAATRRWLGRLDEAWGGGRRADAPAADAPADPPAPEGREASGAAIPDPAAADLDTVTLAALYVRQGLFDRAIGVYERMLTRDPGNTRLAVALEEAHRSAREAAVVQPEGPVAVEQEVSIREQLRRILDGDAPEKPSRDGSWREWLAGLDYPL